MEEEAVKKDLERIFNSGIHPILKGIERSIEYDCVTVWGATYYVIFGEPGKIVSELNFRMVNDLTVFKLQTLWIDTDKREKGLGSFFLNKLIGYASELNVGGIEVRPNEVSWSYYIKKRFELCGKSPNEFLYLPVEPSGKNKV